VLPEAHAEHAAEQKNSTKLLGSAALQLGGFSAKLVSGEACTSKVTFIRRPQPGTEVPVGRVTATLTFEASSDNTTASLAQAAQSQSVGQLFPQRPVLSNDANEFDGAGQFVSVLVHFAVNLPLNPGGCMRVWYGVCMRMVCIRVCMYGACVYGKYNSQRIDTNQRINTAVTKEAPTAAVELRCGRFMYKLPRFVSRNERVAPSTRGMEVGSDDGEEHEEGLEELENDRIDVAVSGTTAHQATSCNPVWNQLLVGKVSVDCTLVWTALVWTALVWTALVWTALVWTALVWTALVWTALVWTALVWTALVWTALVWTALVWTALVWTALVWTALVWTAH
jgi:hypothetical protein